MSITNVAALSLKYIPSFNVIKSMSLENLVLETYFLVQQFTSDFMTSIIEDLITLPITLITYIGRMLFEEIRNLYFL